MNRLHHQIGCATLACTLGLAVLASSAQENTAPASLRRPLRMNNLPEVLQVPMSLAVAGEGRTADDAAATMDLRGAIAQGLNYSPDVRAARFRAESFEQTRRAALGALLPHVDLRAAVGRGRLESVDPWSQLPRKDGSAQLTQALIDEPARREWRRQGVLADSALRQVGGAESSAGLELAGAYLQALQSRLTIEVSQGYEAMLTELLRFVSERAAGGGASVADRERVRARVASARANIADARASLKVALRNLERLVGSAPARLDVGGPASLGIPSELNAAKTLALAQNDDLRAARAEAEAADWGRSAAQAHFLPRVSLEVSHNRNVNAAGTEAYFRDTKAMMVLTVPLFNGGSDLAQMRASTAQREEKNELALTVERKLLQELEAAYANLEAVADRYRSVSEELDADRAVVKAFQAQLTAANRSLLDVLDAYQRLYQTQLDMTALVIGETQNHLKVAHLTGTLMSAFGTVPAADRAGH
ncbi:MAG: TolC family protein [Burkholderiales bacterium]|nr:TolC family protein [Burkholderiales bacterium]